MMHYKNYFIFFLFAYTSTALGCPTHCIGLLKKRSHPFFSAAFYKKCQNTHSYPELEAFLKQYLSVKKCTIAKKLRDKK